MCLSYPGLVLGVDGEGAMVQGEHRAYRAATTLVPDVSPGDFVFVAAGTIIERLDAEEAAEIRRLLDRASEEPDALAHRASEGVGTG
jgi:hydrogenase assembly chaperone HypC/HupF